MKNFEDLNIVYKKAQSRDEAMSLKTQAEKDSDNQKTIVIFFDNRYLLHLAPRVDPYQVRLAIESRLTPKKIIRTITRKKKLLTNKLQEKIQQKKKRASFS